MKMHNWKAILLHGQNPPNNLQGVVAVEALKLMDEFPEITPDIAIRSGGGRVYDRIRDMPGLNTTYVQFECRVTSPLISDLKRRGYCTRR